MKIEMMVVQFLLGVRYVFLKIVTSTLFRKRVVLDPKVIMVFRTCLLGDFLFAIPSLKILREQFPKAKLIFVTTHSGSKAIKNAAGKYVDNKVPLPWFNFIVPSIVDEVISIPSFSKKNLLDVKKRLKSINPDMFFLLPHPGETFKSILKKVIFFRLIGINKNLMGWKVKGDYGFFRKAQQNSGYFGHKIYGPIRALEESSLIKKVAEKDIDFPVQIAPKASNLIETMVRDQNQEALKICFSMGSIQKHKQWALDNFHEVSRYLDKTYSVSLFLVGTVNDLAISRKFNQEGFKNPVIDLIGKTDINELAALFKKMDLVISNDGGSAHLASAVGCKVVSIISGIEFPSSNDPWGNFKYSVYHKTVCSPCYSMTYCPEGHIACMRDLSVRSVIDKVNLAISDLQSGFLNIKNL